MRADVVGMGCNAGLNGLNPLVQWVENHPGKVALLVCCEINSAMYVLDETPRTGIVNSLFGDGAAAAVLTTDGVGPLSGRPGPRIIDFESFCIPEQWAAMRFDWNDDAGRWSFYLDREIPYVIGFNIRRPLTSLLARNGLDFSAVRHWVLHTGGGAVIDSVKLSLGLEEHDVRHTRSVLRDYGNISSGSFLVSLERLLAEGGGSDGDLGVMVTMGPGAQIETALFQFGQCRMLTTVGRGRRRAGADGPALRRDGRRRHGRGPRAGAGRRRTRRDRKTSCSGSTAPATRSPATSRRGQPAPGRPTCATSPAGTRPCPGSPG